MSNADIGYDSEFAIESATPGTYTKVAEVVSITPPPMTRDAVDVTHMESPNEYRQFIPGLADLGEATITINFVPSATDALVTAFNAKRGNYQITFPNNVRLQFAGIVTGYTIDALSTGEKMSATFTIKATGAPTFAAAA